MRRILLAIAMVAGLASPSVAQFEVFEGDLSVLGTLAVGELLIDGELLEDVIEIETVPVVYRAVTNNSGFSISAESYTSIVGVSFTVTANVPVVVLGQIEASVSGNNQACDVRLRRQAGSTTYSDVTDLAGGVYNDRHEVRTGTGVLEWEYVPTTTRSESFTIQMQHRGEDGTCDMERHRAALVVASFPGNIGAVDTGGGGGGETNVQVDWLEADSTSDAFILNKPDLTSVGEPNVQVDWAEADTTEDAFILNKPDIDAQIAAAIAIVNAAIALKANIESPVLTGEPHSTTPPADDRSTRIATTEWVSQYTPATPTPTPTPTITGGYIGWLDATATTLTDTQILAGSAFSGDQVTVPPRADDGFLWFARTEYPSNLFFDGPASAPPPVFSVLSGFTQLTAVDVNGVTQYVGITNVEQNASILGYSAFRIRFN